MRTLPTSLVLAFAVVVRAGLDSPAVMLAVWPASYVNCVPTNDLVIVSKFWKPGRSLETRSRDNDAGDILRELRDVKSPR